MKRSACVPVFVTLLLSLIACASSQAGPQLTEVARGLSQPVAIAHAGDDRLFVVERAGTVRVVVEGEVRPEPFLDLRDRVGSRGGEQGLLGLAFPPGFAASGRYYVYYTDLAGGSVLSRFTATGDGTDPASERVLLRQPQPASNHNGGQLAFGPDGYLYLGLGDGGSGGDPRGAGQSLSTWLGKLLRLDVSGDDLAVPADNPFVGREGALPEIWAYGFRNPWRFSFDPATGDLFIADVGQNAFEEVNLQPAASRGGENYGWNVMEGAACFSPREGCDADGLTLPIVTYPHGPEWGRSITGGYVYRGSALPELQGAYVFADFVSGKVWRADATDGAWQVTLLLDTGFNVSTFGVDAAGELYLADYASGRVYRLAAD